MRSRCVGMLSLAVAFVLPLSLVTSAHAVHLFPLTPDFDPLGHDCAQHLEEDPADASARVTVVGFNFIDDDTGSSTTEVGVGDAVTWSWLLDHCHSVTFEDPDLSTQGANGFMPEEPELVRMSDDGDAFTVTFEQPGTYTYICVHHASVGMTGTVVVAPA